MKGFINGDNQFIDTSIDRDNIKHVSDRLTKSLEFYLIEPRNHLKKYGLKKILNTIQQIRDISIL